MALEVAAAVYALGSMAFFTFWVLAVFPRLPILPIGRTSGALLGATLMVIFQIESTYEAYASLDLPILGLLFGTMVVSIYLEGAGLFNHLGDVLSWGKPGPRGLMFRLCVLVSVASALFTNDTVCVAMTGFVLKMCKEKSLPAEPFLVALATSANIGSAATPIGNPQNLVIAVQADIPFGQFLHKLLPPVIVGVFLNTLMLLLVYRKSLADGKGKAAIASYQNDLDDGVGKLTAIATHTNSLSNGIGQTAATSASPSSLLPDNGEEIQISASQSSLFNTYVDKDCEDFDSPIIKRGEDAESGRSITEAAFQITIVPSIPAVPSGREDEIRIEPPNYVAEITKQSSEHFDNSVLSNKSNGHSIYMGNGEVNNSKGSSKLLEELGGVFKAKLSFFRKLCVYLVTIGMLAALLAGLDMSWSALTAAVALMALDFKDSGPTLDKVSYSLLVFFSGMFITVDGFNRTKIPGLMWSKFEPLARINRASGVVTLTIVIIILSNVASNVPTGPQVAISAEALQKGSSTKAWLILAWVSTLAGNLTLVGSAANLIVSEQAKRDDSSSVNLSCSTHLRFGPLSTCIVTFAGLPLLFI